MVSLFVMPGGMERNINTGEVCCTLTRCSIMAHHLPCSAHFQLTLKGYKVAYNLNKT